MGLVSSRQFARVVGLAAILVAAALARVPVARAAEGPAQVTAGHKGLVGLGLIGAELGLVVPAVLGLDATWALIVFPVLGATGGALGGHYAIDRPNRAVGSVVTLSLGLALVVPAVVIAAAATAYDPAADGVLLAPRAERRHRQAQLAALAGPGLLRLAHGRLGWGMPGVDVVPGGVSTLALGLMDRTVATEVHLALVSGAF